MESFANLPINLNFIFEFCLAHVLPCMRVFVSFPYAKTYPYQWSTILAQLEEGRNNRLAEMTFMYTVFAILFVLYATYMYHFLESSEVCKRLARYGLICLAWPDPTCLPLVISEKGSGHLPLMCSLPAHQHSRGLKRCGCDNPALVDLAHPMQMSSGLWSDNHLPPKSMLSTITTKAGRF
jgi:hypothetical protein